MFKTNQLVIIAGTPAVGKTALMKKVREGDCSTLCEQLGIDTSSAWLYLLAKELPLIRQPIVERLILHYDIYHHRSQNDESRYVCELIRKSDAVVILTLCASHQILSERVTFRLRRVVHRRGLRGLKRIVILWKKRRIYTATFKALALYQAWFRFVAQFIVADHLLLDTTNRSIAEAYPFDMDQVERILMN